NGRDAKRREPYPKRVEQIDCNHSHTHMGALPAVSETRIRDDRLNHRSPPITTAVIAFTTDHPDWLLNAMTISVNTAKCPVDILLFLQFVLVKECDRVQPHRRMRHPRVQLTCLSRKQIG